jgi:hypothetical protein
MHDPILNVPTSLYSDLIKEHLKNIKETFIEEINNLEIIAKVNSLSHSFEENVQLLQSLLSALNEIQPLLCKFSFLEFFYYI